MHFRESGTPLQAALTELLRQRKMSRSDFARLVGLTKGTLSRLEHKPPPKLPKRLNVQSWAEKLGLDKEERLKLQLAAEISWSPALVQKLLLRQSPGGK